jgi:hypothetical protein
MIVETCIRFVSTMYPLSSGRPKEAETRRIHVSTLSPLCNNSKDFIEVLCLGLEGTNPRISRFALLAIQINLVIEPLTFELGILGFWRCGGHHEAGYTELVIGCGLTLGRRGYLNGTKLATADIIEDGTEASAGNLDDAVGVVQAEQPGSAQELGFDQAVIRHKTAIAVLPGE